mmetsp:Transcript_16931/g.18904  ORF Transcript_16931/g.18904 Transcript_16931/m.18904 type:complete len:122 (+) Transcript_16931:1317-1682(+)
MQLNTNSTLLQKNPYIHVDVYPAMTGITRFLYENQNIGWRYNRTEYLSDEEKNTFTHLFTDSKKIAGFRLINKIESYDRIDFKAREIDFKVSMYVLEREDIYQERISKRSKDGSKCKNKKY